MSLELSFEKMVNYDTRKAGISLSVELRLGELSSVFEAKIDTGSTFWVFERSYGEKLGLNIEAGERQRIATTVGSFLTFGHWATLTVEDFTFDSMVFFARDENHRRNVLGRFGWLNRVLIGINDYDGKLYLSRYENDI
ncbi:hypothetical protein BH20ACI1_BH20ACI1_13900 [soil metagenome]